MHKQDEGQEEDIDKEQGYLLRLMLHKTVAVGKHFYVSYVRVCYSRDCPSPHQQRFIRWHFRHGKWLARALHSQQSESNGVS